MRRRLAQREVALAAVALLAGAIALAIAAKTRSDSSELPAAYGSYPARAAPQRTGGVRQAHSVRHGHPGEDRRASRIRCCRAARSIYITYNGKHVLTQVIDRGPPAPGRSSSSPMRSRDSSASRAPSASGGVTPPPIRG